ncbi:hypothetical protein IQ06DRAFT_294267 [Phaeosphaeriaceae sp. SRC1lsM3a]|nr:hypothetical protein IQ06DRAFT_294267 [Stagonospora sp. SRC1lsM3a]
MVESSDKKSTPASKRLANPSPRRKIMRYILSAILITIIAIAYHFFCDPLNIGWFLPTHRSILNDRAIEDERQATKMVWMDGRWHNCPKEPTPGAVCKPYGPTVD